MNLEIFFRWKTNCKTNDRSQQPHKSDNKIVFSCTLALNKRNWMCFVVKSQQTQQNRKKKVLCFFSLPTKSFKNNLKKWNFRWMMQSVMQQFDISYAKHQLKCTVLFLCHRGRIPCRTHICHVDCDRFKKQSKKISNDQELIQSDPTSCPQNQKGNN